jgi:hypothetical protein
MVEPANFLFLPEPREQRYPDFHSLIVKTEKYKEDRDIHRYLASLSLYELYLVSNRTDLSPMHNGAWLVDTDTFELKSPMYDRGSIAKRPGGRETTTSTCPPESKVSNESWGGLSELFVKGNATRIECT